MEEELSNFNLPSTPIKAASSDNSSTQLVDSIEQEKLRVALELTDTNEVELTPNNEGGEEEQLDRDSIENVESVNSVEPESNHSRSDSIEANQLNTIVENEETDKNVRAFENF
jgi:hypothetical protein